MLFPFGDFPYKIIVCFCMLASTAAFVNIALNKPAYQRKPWYKKDILVAKNAVDGQKTDRTWNGGECTMTYGEQNATWWVNLTSIHKINHITVYYMKIYGFWGTVGSSVYVSNTTDIADGYMCFNDSNYTLDTVPAIVNISCSTRAQYVIYYNEKRPGFIYPVFNNAFAANMICEIEVYGCPNTGFYYGTDCCSNVNCRYCQMETGICMECSPGYKGDRCDLVCDKGWYGVQCREPCNHCRDLNQCLHTNGTCLKGCMAGYGGHLCKTQCTHRKYGDGCQTECGHCKDMMQCNHVDGACLNGCKPGYTQDNCTEHCEMGTYGVNCNETCGHCRDINQCSYTNGTCFTGCNAGYQGALCKTDCEIGTYGVDCKETCGHCRDLTKCSYTNGTCFTGCNAGYQGALCKTVDELSRRTLIFFIVLLCSILGLTWICWIISTICNRRGRCGQQNFKQCKKEVQAEDLQMKAESGHMARNYEDTKCQSPVENQTYFNVPEDNTYVEMKHIYQN